MGKGERASSDLMRYSEPRRGVEGKPSELSRAVESGRRTRRGNNRLAPSTPLASTARLVQLA
jgi:hypothetical protein